MKFPNLLVITSVDFINNVGPTENTLRSFLSFWNKDNVRLLVCKDFNADYSHDGKSIYTLGHKDIIVASYLLNSNRTAKTNVGFQGLSTDGKTQVNAFASIKSSLSSKLVNFYQLLPYRFGRNLKEWMDDFHPDVIYFCGTSYREFFVCKQIMSRYNIPVVPHFLDDWPNIRLAMSVANSMYKRKFISLFEFIMNRSPFGLCISDLMAQMYMKRYSKQFYALMNSVSEVSINDCKAPLKIEKFLYAGSLYLRRDESLLQICDFLSQGYFQRIEFNIFAPEEQWAELKNKFAKYPFVHYGGFLSAEQLKKEIYKTDIIVFTESFDKSVLKFSRLSLSTRVPEFLASGKPILAIGPSEQGSIQYLEHNNAAFVITESTKNIQVFQDMQNSELIQEKLDNARRLFLSNHTTKSQQEKFYNWIIEAVRS